MRIGPLSSVIILHVCITVLAHCFTQHLTNTVEKQSLDETPPSGLSKIVNHSVKLTVPGPFLL